MGKSIRVDTWRRLLVPITALGLLSFLCGALLQTSTTSAASVPRNKPSILTLRYPSKDISSAGGEATVTARLVGARTCELVLDNHPGIAVTIARVASCASGNYTSRLSLSFNPRSVRVPLKLTLTAAGRGGSVSRTFIVWQAKGTDQPTTTATTLPTTPTTTPTTATTLPSTTPTTTPTTATTLPSTTPTTVPGASGASGTSQLSTSDEWSGYVIPSTTTVTKVLGEWTVPVLNCGQTQNAQMTTWVGTGGNGGSSGVLLQTGTEDDCVGGFQFDLGWTDETPSSFNSAQDFDNLSIQPGDQIEASVYQSAGQWITRLDDQTQGLSGWMIVGDDLGVGQDSSTGFTNQESTSGLSYSGGDSAEWIVGSQENTSDEPLSDFGTLQFSDLQTSLSSWSLTTSEGVKYVNSADSAVSVPSQTGSTSFSLTWQLAG